uniref:Uncharacterized protein n=1 Tax=Pseudoalteromonas rubra TaxID=43658 RepID=A0A0F4Q9U4_9GAMM|nr:hypothetical protein TW77_23670 [Pseudoalteromonas rubra]
MFFRCTCYTYFVALEEPASKMDGCGWAGYPGEISALSTEKLSLTQTQKSPTLSNRALMYKEVRMSMIFMDELSAKYNDSEQREYI